jgi:predicted RNA-binding Zn ribbon-like protein
VDFVRYAESSAALLNAELTDLDGLVGFLSERAWLQQQVVEKDVTALRRFQRDLRPAFEASAADDAQGVVDVLNALLERHPITPRIADHNPANLHIHVANRAASVADLLIGESLLGLANLICDLGPTRLGVCAATPCTNVYVDTSPNQSRRYCSERCSSRANVAAFRARQKAAAAS